MVLIANSSLKAMLLVRFNIAYINRMDEWNDIALNQIFW